MVGEFEAGMSPKVIKVRVENLLFFGPVNRTAAFDSGRSLQTHTAFSAR